MYEPRQPRPDDHELFGSLPRILGQIGAVIAASAGFVLILYSLGVLGGESDGRSTTTGRVAQLSPIPTAAPSTPGATGATTSPRPGDASTTTVRGTDETVRTDAGPTNEAPSPTSDLSAPAPRIAHVSASDIRADSTDNCGAPTDYRPIYLVDSNRDTAWMTEGDGVGAVLTIDLAEPSLVSEVGLVPGYDKSDPCTGTNRFDELRRVTEVRWTFDDGTSIIQEVSPTPDLQTTSLERPVVTATVTMTILATTEPGVDRFDYAPVSEIVVS